MKRLIPLLIFGFLAFGLSAQYDIEVLPNPVYETGDPDETDIKGDAVIVNNSAREAVLLWERIIVDAPEDWETWVCDANLCYFSGVTSCPTNNPVIIPGGDTVILQSHIDPHGVSGEGHFQINIFPADDVDNILDTANYFYAVGVTGIEDIDLQGLKVFPNPTSDYFTVSNSEYIDQIEVYSIVGRKIKSFDTALSNRYEINELNKGLYLVAFVGSDGSILKTVRMSKI